MCSLCHNFQNNKLACSTSTICACILVIIQYVLMYVIVVNFSIHKSKLFTLDTKQRCLVVKLLLCVKFIDLHNVHACFVCNQFEGIF